MKVLFFDIETAPNMAWIWGMYNEVTSYSAVESEWYTLCWAARWMGNKKVMSSAIVDFPKWRKDPRNDKRVLEALWDLLDEADVVVAHNAKKFDVRKVNARFIYHGFKPPSPYKVVDTLKVARRGFMFTSNRLDDLAAFLGLSRKIQHEGFELWKKCMDGQKTAWKTMVKYCRQDVKVLEQLYHKLRPWIKVHPNAGNYTDGKEAVCKYCGGAALEKRGYSYTQVGKYQRYQCKECGGWMRGRENLNPKEKRRNLLMTAR